MRARVAVVIVRDGGRIHVLEGLRAAGGRGKGAINKRLQIIIGAHLFWLISV